MNPSPPAPPSRHPEPSDAPRLKSAPGGGLELLRASKRFAREIRWKSWWCLWTTLGALGGAYVLALLPMHWLPRSAASVLVGLTLVRMFIIYHDHQHGTILRGSSLARLVMLFFGVWSLNPPSSWKRSHNHHHKNNAKIFGASIGSYPVMTTRAYAEASWWQRRIYELSRHPLTILLGYGTVFVFGMCLKPLLAAPRRHLDCAAALLLQASLIGLLAVFAPRALVFVVLLPMSVAAALGAYLFYSQHNFPGVKLQDRTDWNHVQAALESSSYTEMGPILRWFTGNIGYHHVHHLNAHIPFYRLPEAMAGIAGLPTPAPIRLSPGDIYRCFRLKLWDPDQNCMVSFGGARKSSQGQGAR